MTEQTAIVCRLDALDAAERERQSALRARLDSALERVEELPDGYLLRYRADASLFIAAAEWITLERRCCPFLRFGLEWHGQQPAPSLRLTGDAGVKEFLAAAVCSC